MSQTQHFRFAYHFPMSGSCDTSLSPIVFLLILLSASSSAQEGPLWPTPPTPAGVDRFQSHESAGRHGQRTEFRKLAWIGLAAWAADTTSTQIGLLRGLNESNPIFGQHPSPARLWATSISIEGFSLYTCHRESQEHPRGRFWKAAARLSIALHAAATANNVIALR